MTVEQNNNYVLISFPYESCGGGNNWGFHTVVYGDYDGKKWNFRKDYQIPTIDKISQEGNGFRINYLEYADMDPRCCPSLKKTILIDPSKDNVKKVEEESNQTMFFSRGLTSFHKKCNSSQEINDFFMKNFTYDIKKQKYNIKKGYSIPKEIQSINIKNQGDHSIITTKVNESLYGLNLIEVSRGIGHENGIGFITLKFKEPKSTLLKVAKQDRWGLNNKNQLDVDEFTVMSISEEKNNALLICDFSN